VSTKGQTNRQEEKGRGRQGKEGASKLLPCRHQRGGIMRVNFFSIRTIRSLGREEKKKTSGKRGKGKLGDSTGSTLTPHGKSHRPQLRGRTKPGRISRNRGKRRGRKKGWVEIEGNQKSTVLLYQDSGLQTMKGAIPKK